METSFFGKQIRPRSEYKRWIATSNEFDPSIEDFDQLRSQLLNNLFSYSSFILSRNWKQSAQSCEMIASNLESSAPKFKSTPSKRDDFWRLTWGAEDSIAFLISNTILYRLDLAVSIESIAGLIIYSRLFQASTD